jgi:hypothetical protein
MKHLLKCVFIVIITFIFFGCKFIPINKFLSIENGKFTANVIIIDNKNVKYEDIIKPDWAQGWSEEILGDFRLVYIKTENALEGIFIISNVYKKKIIPYDIITIKEYTKRIMENSNKLDNFNQEMMSPYEIIIKITEDIFEIAYNDKEFNIQSYFNYDENYSYYNEKYLKEYGFNE